MKCAYIQANGRTCQANAMKESSFCFVHNPETKEQHALAVTKGGQLSRKDKLSLPPIVMKSPSDIVAILEEVTNGVRSGAIPSQMANTLAYVCSHALKAMEASTLDDRLELVESVLLERKVVRKG